MDVEVMVMRKEPITVDSASLGVVEGPEEATGILVAVVLVEVRTNSGEEGAAQ